MPLEPGSRLDGYELLRPLGAGGMGAVWLAREIRLERQVALKLLPPEMTSDASRIARFQQEARAASALGHPNVCHIYALGQAQDGQHYNAMEYVAGEASKRVSPPSGRRCGRRKMSAKLAGFSAEEHLRTVVHCRVSALGP